jgi:hypothetical protein
MYSNGFLENPDETHPDRKYQRNYDWQHLTCRNIISMPDKWEYPGLLPGILLFMQLLLFMLTRILPSNSYSLS